MPARSGGRRRGSARIGVEGPVRHDPRDLAVDLMPRIAYPWSVRSRPEAYDGRPALRDQQRRAVA